MWFGIARSTGLGALALAALLSDIPFNSTMHPVAVQLLPSVDEDYDTDRNDHRCSQGQHGLNKRHFLT